MKRLRLINFLTYLGLAVFYLVLVAWMIDKTVSRNQEQWEQRTQAIQQVGSRGSLALRPSRGD